MIIVAIRVLIFFSLFSFRFFFWLILVEILTLLILVTLKNKHSTRVFMCGILILGACEVGLALRLIVKVTRFSGVENIKKIRCEAF